MIDDVFDVISRMKVGYVDLESVLQDRIAKAIAESLNVTVRREVVLPGHGRIDLLVDKTGIEIKHRQPWRKRIQHQIEEYTGSDMLESLVVVLPRSMDLPGSCNGKPVRVIAMSRAWGVAV